MKLVITHGHKTKALAAALARLCVIADAAAQVAHPRDETHLWNRPSLPK